jgi:carbamoyltransferase
MVVGISGASRNACVAACVDGRAIAVCEEERLIRVRGVGLTRGRLPEAALQDVIARSHASRADVSAYVVAEPEIQLPPTLPVIVVDHHEAHAATAFLTSPFRRAAIIVCDSRGDRELSVWIGTDGSVEERDWRWQGCGLASLYAECARLFWNGSADAHALEVLAHLGTDDQLPPVDEIFGYEDGRLRKSANWRAELLRLIDAERSQRGLPRQTARAIQRRLGELLLEVVSEIRATVDIDTLCLGGGLFYNTYFNTLIRTSGIFADVFVPANPGNAGLAVGASLLVAGRGGAHSRAALSPFLGPDYDAETIKHTLDGCKLSYEYVTEDQVLEATVAALQRGQLVGWFQGPMEWGHRALGHRSILASPRSPYVLDNLNFFLRKRDRSRPFGVAVSEDAAADLFCGPPASRYMEFQYRLRDDRLRHVMPTGATAIRVQTVAADTGLFWSLLKRMELSTGSGAVVNTSFNAFHEPIVCSPGDAVRVFYGTGLDMLVIGRFILRK